MNRSDGVTPIGEFAYMFIQEAIKCRHEVIVSWQIVRELSSKLEIGEEIVWQKIFRPLAERNKITEVPDTGEQNKEAKIISKNKNLPFTDCLIALIARDNNAAIVSRDFHFNELTEIVEFFKPEEL